MKICSVCTRCFEDAAIECVKEGHPPLSEVRDGHPRMVPGYELERLAGAWTNAAAYSAQRLDCGQDCHIRIASTDARGGEAFLRDAETAATLFDAGFVYVYEYGRLEGGEFYVVTEDARATTLREHLDSNGIPDLLTSIRIVGKIAEVLHAIHLKGLTHGAIRPENILLTFDEDNHPRVRLGNIDLGGVVARNILSNKFLIDNAVGAIRYFGPEQCSGEPATTRTDIYGLGVVLHELLAGAPPFDAPKAAALMGMHVNQRPPEVVVDDFELRMLVTHSVSEALQKRPSFRQSSADLFARQMRHMEQLATHVSTPPPAVEATIPQRDSRSVRRRAVPAEPVPPPRLYPGPPYGGDHFPSGTGLPIEDADTPSTPGTIDFDGEDGHGPIFAEESETATVHDSPLLPVRAEQDVEQAGAVHEDRSPERSSLPERRQRLRALKRRSGPSSIAQLTSNQESPEYSISAPAGHSGEGLDSPTSPAGASDVALSGSAPLTPRLIHWDQPEDDVPSLEDFRVQMVADSSASSLDEGVTPERTRPELPFSVTRLVERESAPHDVPPLSAVFEAWTEMRRAANAEEAEANSAHAGDRVGDTNPRTDQNGSVPPALNSKIRPGAELTGTAPAVAMHSDETAAVVSPRARTDTFAGESAVTPITTESLRVSPQRLDVGFAPTILGEDRRDSPARSSGPISMFSEQGDPVETTSGAPRRTALVVSGSVSLVIVALAAFGFLGTVSTDPDPGEAASAPATAQIPARPSAVPSLLTGGPAATERQPVKVYRREASTEDQAAPARRKTQPAETAPNPMERAGDGLSPRNEVPKRARTGDPPDKRYDGNRKYGRPDPAAEKTAPPRNNPAGTTRPRIVADPLK